VALEIIECRGVRYAVGLYWWQASEKGELRAPQRTARRLVREIGSMTDPDSPTPACDTLVVDRAGGSIGLGALGSLERVYALAPALARARPGTGVLWCLIPDPGRMVVIATLAGRVLGEGDFSGREAEGRARRALLLDQYGERLSERIEGRRGDSGWGLLEEALEAIPRSGLPRTRPLYLRRKRLLAVSLAVLLLLGLVMENWGFRTGFAETRTAGGGVRKGGVAVSRTAASLRAVLGFAPARVLAACRRKWQSLDLVEGGWSFARFVCTGQRAVVVWRYRPGASFTHLPGRSVLSAGPDQVVSSFELKPGPETDLTRRLLPRSRLEDDFYEWVRREGIRAASLNWQNSPPGGVQPWAQARWSVVLERGDPFRLVPALSAWRGLSIHRMEATLSLNGQLVWHLTGVIYADPW
jgi:hypothetical protein